MTKIYNIDFPAGAHTEFSGVICETLKKSINNGMYATQFFMGNPKGFNRAKIAQHDIDSCRKILSKYPMHVFSHFPYIANLAGSKDSLAWSGDEIQDRKTSHIISSLEYELGVLANFNSSRNGVVIHPGNFPKRREGLLAIATSINKISFPNDAKLILENSAGQGTSLATTLEEIKTIIDNVDENKRQNIGVCIDTCHTFSYGDYNLSEKKEVEKLFSDFDRIIGLDYLTLVHLNDSETPLKSRKDRHACLKTGHIWGRDSSALSLLLKKCKNLDIPLVLETSVSDMITLATLGTLEE